MTSETMSVELENVPAEQLPEIERQVVSELEQQADFPECRRGLTLEQVYDEELISTNHRETIVELSAKLPEVIFKLFAYGDLDGGWPWVEWIKAGEVIGAWYSDRRMPESFEAYERQEPAGAEPVNAQLLACLQRIVDADGDYYTDAPECAESVEELAKAMEAAEYLLRRIKDQGLEPEPAGAEL